MGNGKRSAEAMERRAAKKAIRVENKNQIVQKVEENWTCTSILCRNSNFPRRNTCNLCGAPKPFSELIKVKKQPRPLKKEKQPSKNTDQQL
jgi:hypothetical protein